LQVFTGSSTSCLVCRIGERLLAVPLAAVVEVMRPLPVETFPGTPAYIRGVTTIRGAVLPVIDVGLLIGVDGCVPTRFVTIALEQRGAALAVQSVIGVQNLSAEALQDLPPLLDSVNREMFSAIGSLNAELLLVLDHTHLMPDSVWASLTERVTTP
jgi:purine-binding chemotaxis protein CheW